MAFATLDDYAARYGLPEDEARCSVLLQDASDAVQSAFEATFGRAYAEGVSAAFDRNVVAVCCLLVHRAMSADDDTLGATQWTQSAGGYSASVTYGGESGSIWLGKSELARLGLDVQVVRVMRPEVGG